MSEAKFTNGEWEFYVDKFGGELEITSTDRVCMACIATVKGAYFDEYEPENKYEEEQKANASLLKAAPKMYQMLSDIMQNIDVMSNEDSEQVNRIGMLLAEARGES